MKFSLLIFFLLVFISCGTDKTIDNVTDNLDLSDSTEMTFIDPEPNFNEYVFLHKDTNKTIKNELGHFSEIVPIGQISLDSTLYKVELLLKNISFINHYKIRSILSLTSEKNDTLQFETSHYDALPIDIYENHFVFLTEDSTYAFSSASIHEQELLCFDFDGHCLMSYKIWVASYEDYDELTF